MRRHSRDFNFLCALEKIGYMCIHTKGGLLTKTKKIVIIVDQ